MEQMITLSDGDVGGRYRVMDFHLPLKIEKRLEALGMTQGTSISVLNSKHRGIMIVKIRGTRFALGKNITKNIQVRCES